MPCHDYRLPDGSVRERCFTLAEIEESGLPQYLTVGVDEARQLVTAEWVPPSFNWGMTDMVLKEKARDGIVPYEPGMDKDVERNRAAIAASQDAERRRIVGEVVQDYTT
jgi:hypothetical protein